MPEVIAHEPLLRLGCFAAVFAAVALWEFAAPRRQPLVGRALRWPNNFGIVALDTLLVRLVLPTAAVGIAIKGEAAGWGLLGLVAWPAWLEVLIAVLALDLAIYLQHVLFHATPSLWRLHRMHHADLDFDVSTGVRFHPIEILLSLVIKIAVVAGVGAPALAVLIFEILLNATSMFNHGNVRMPAGLDRIVRLLAVTPDMHRVHHSVEPSETNTNFGFSFSVWDRLFGTYRAAPAKGHTDMTIGLTQFRSQRELWLDRLLTQPFRQDTGPQPFNPTTSLTGAPGGDTPTS